MRTATTAELHMPKIAVQLAAGGCVMHVNSAGTLLSPHPVAPIVSVAALLKLGYSLHWSHLQCNISHPTRGKLEVDTTSGCLEVNADTALELIKDYEALVGRKQTREASVKRMMADLEETEDAGLVKILRSEGSEAEAALRVLLSRRFPAIPPETLEQVVTPLQEVVTDPTWNRKTRRRNARCQGLLVHMFCGASRHAFEKVANQHDLAHVAVDTKENLLRQSTYQYLMLEAVRGRIRLLVGGPPCRTNSVCRYFPVSEDNPGPRPVCGRGDSLGYVDHEYLTGSEVAMRQIDDLLYRRFLALFCIAAECNREMKLPAPGLLWNSQKTLSHGHRTIRSGQGAKPTTSSGFV